MTTLRETLLDASNAGALLAAIDVRQITASHDDGALAFELASLHNAGLIDVVSTFEALSSSSTGSEFFLKRDIFERLLPNISAPVQAVMRCVLKLYKSAGQDFAAGTILNRFEEFCTKDPLRLEQALRSIEEDPAEFVDLLVPVLVAGTSIDSGRYLKATIRLCSCNEVEIRRRAVFALGRAFKNKDDRVTNDQLATLKRVVDSETDDTVIANALRSAFSLLEQDGTLEEPLTPLISACLLKGDEQTGYAAASVLAFQATKLPSAVRNVLLEALASVNPENRGTLDLIDYALAALLKGDQPDIAIQFMERLLLSHPDVIDFSVFDSATHTIQANESLLNKIATRWLRNGSRALCEGVAEFGGARRIENNLVIRIDPQELDPSTPADVLGIARRAIGYFFIAPITAASVVISLIEAAADQETIDALGDLLIQPLLLNYTGELREYVRKRTECESGATKATLEVALDRIDNYLKALHEVPPLPALYPSELQHNAYRRHMSETMQASYKEAQKRSVLMNLFAKSTLLYGRKSINYVYGADGKQHRTEMPLSSHGVSMEFPRMENIDPIGTDVMLRVFRNSKTSS